ESAQSARRSRAAAGRAAYRGAYRRLPGRAAGECAGAQLGARWRFGALGSTHLRRGASASFASRLEPNSVTDRPVVSTLGIGTPRPEAMHPPRAWLRRDRRGWAL